MDQKLKNVLIVVSLVAMLAVSFSAISYAMSYAKSVEPSSFKSFSVTGEGKITAVPDVATFTATVITEGGKDLGSLQKENSTKANKIVVYLKSLKIENKDIKTTSFDVEPRYEYYSCVSGGVCPPPTIVGYTVRQSVNVKIRDFNIVGEALSNVVKNGANSVSALSFTLDKRDEVVNQAKAEAISKAKVRAKAMAKAGGFRLGDLLSIDETNSSMPVAAYSRGAGSSDQMMKVSMELAPTVEPGSQEIIETVSLRYEIK